VGGGSSRFLRFAVRALGLTLAVGGAAALIVRGVQGDGALAAVAWASAIALTGAVLGRLVGLLVPQGRPESPAQASLVAMGVRLLATASLCFVAINFGVAPKPTFVVVVLAQYLALLVLEVGQAVAEVRAMGAGPHAPQGGGAA
jgi:peptidoglycan/LPS O-acetylase OafA/YrhL